MKLFRLAAMLFCQGEAAHETSAANPAAALMRDWRGEMASGATAVQAHPCFAEARRLYCADVPAVFLGRPLARRAMAERMRFVLVALMLQFDADWRAGRALPPLTLALLTRMLGTRGLASADRLRPLLRHLADQGLLRLEPIDARARRIVPTPALEALLQPWLRRVLMAAALVAPVPVDAEQRAAAPDAATRHLGRYVRSFLEQGFALTDEFPTVQRLTARLGGSFLTLALADLPAGARLDVPALAQTAGVSAVQLRKLLAWAAAEGWLSQAAGGGITLAPAMAAELDRYVAAELWWALAD